MPFDDIQGHVDPPEKLGAPGAGLAAVAPFVVPHDLVEEALNGGEYLGASGVVLGRLEVERLVVAMRVLGLGRGVAMVVMGKLLNDGVAVDPDVLFRFVGDRRRPFLLFLKIVAVGWYFALDSGLDHSYFLNPLVHLEVVGVYILGAALHGLDLLEMVLFEVVHAVC